MPESHDKIRERMTNDTAKDDGPTCVLCGGEIQPHLTPEGEIYWTQGHNAEPLNNGRCCDRCNDRVIAARMSIQFGRRD
jgi:hypothetical protein